MASHTAGASLAGPWERGVVDVPAQAGKRDACPCWSPIDRQEVWAYRGGSSHGDV